MLRLLKYDFRRDQDKFLSVYIITIIAHVGITILTDIDRLSLSIITYVIAAMVLLIMTVQSFARNLNSYNRGLLPLPGMYKVFSPILLYLILLLGIILLAFVHLLGYLLLYSTSVLPENFWSVAALSLFQLYWSAIFLMIVLMFSITVAKSLRFKGRVWVGIATAYLLQNGLSFIEQLIFPNYLNSIQNFQFEVIKATDVPSGLRVSNDQFNIFPVLFEAAVLVILVIMIIKLVKNRVDL